MEGAALPSRPTRRLLRRCSRGGPHWTLPGRYHCAGQATLRLPGADHPAAAAEQLASLVAKFPNEIEASGATDLAAEDALSETFQDSKVCRSRPTAQPWAEPAQIAQQAWGIDARAPALIVNPSGACPSVRLNWTVPFAAEQGGRTSASQGANCREVAVHPIRGARPGTGRARRPHPPHPDPDPDPMSVRCGLASSVRRSTGAPNQVADSKERQHRGSNGDSHPPGVGALAPRQRKQHGALAGSWAVLLRHADGRPKHNEDDEASQPRGK